MSGIDTGEEWARQIAAFDRAALARAITLIESSREEDQERASHLFSLLAIPERPAFRLGITGAPGAGKSTLIDALGLELCGRSLRVAALAVDPSSSVSGGSILGDKTRMSRLSQHANAYVRSSPSRCVPGGIGAATDPAIRLCEAAGCDFVIIETVGSGQAEICVADIADGVLVLVDPGGGDGIQALKKGILELADFVCISKADGVRRSEAEGTLAAYSGSMLDRKSRLPGIEVKVMLTSAHSAEHVSELADSILAFEDVVRPRMESVRAEQAERDFYLAVRKVAIDRIMVHPGMVQAARRYVSDGTARPHPAEAARRVVDEILGSEK